MNYQLVIQFRGAALETFSHLGNFKDRVEETLGESDSFDGLDVGPRGTNVFIYSMDPEAAFQRLRPVLDHAESAEGFTAAYRTVAQETFQILWPAGGTGTFSLR